jgi:uncharacterized membrane protein YfcA
MLTSPVLPCGHDPPVDLVYPISGFGFGFLVGITGVGGGSLMTPLLIILFGFIQPPRLKLIFSMRLQPRTPVRLSTASKTVD